MNTDSKGLIVAAVIGAVAVILAGLLGAALSGSLNDRNALEVVRNQAEAGRQQLDLVDLRNVLDDTARHLARATRSVQVLKDRCDTAVKERVAPAMGPRRTASPVFKRWQGDVDKAYGAFLDIRADRERLRIRLRRKRNF